tara:strand:+ start:216 stop:554 length:339 start_codon:yes stop_codon:yes gene_type:complete
MRIGVSFSIPIEEILSHLAVVLESRASLDGPNNRYTKLLKQLEVKTYISQEEISDLLKEIEGIRKDLLRVDQTLEDTASILNGYFGFLGEMEKHEEAEQSDQVKDGEETDDQ